MRGTADLQGKKQLETEPETATPPGGSMRYVCLGKRKSWGICNLDQTRSHDLVLPQLITVIHTHVTPLRTHLSSAQRFPCPDSGPGAGPLGLAAICKFGNITQFRFSDSATFKLHNLAVLK